MRISKPFVSATPLLACFLLNAAALHAASNSSWKFDFGSGAVQSGYTRVLPTTAYNTTTGYGFASTSGLTAVSRGAPDPLREDYITSSAPFAFSANVPNGNYNVTVTTGDNNGTSETSIKSEVERVVAQNIKTTTGQFSQYSFTVNIKDGVLDLTFYGAAPKVNAIDIASTTTAITMFIAGDSTVCDQTNIPYAGWGQEFTSYLKPGLAVANYADSGESSTSFWNGFYVPGIQPRIKSGDYLFIEFGHNDEKSLTTAQYQAGLQKYIDDARAHGAIPVLLTPTERIIFSGTTLTWSHGAFPDAMKQLATANNVPCIDLNAKTHNAYQAMGQTAATALFVAGDKTHTNEAGALLIAGFVRDGILELNLSPFKNFVIGTTPPPGAVVVQSETGTWDTGGVLETTNAGWTGTGYVNSGNAIGAYSEVTVNVATAGSHTITFRYANGTTTNRPADLSINGTVVQTAVAFNGTGAWTVWSDVTVTKTLNAGNNTIRLTATTANGCANLDKVTVQ
jgi:lysophospholipase L1-like esterase